MKTDENTGRSVAIVTGGSMGIGQGIVHALLDQAYRVYVMDRMAMQESEHCIAFYGDVADVHARDAFIDFVLSTEKSIDVVVHNAMRFIPGVLSNTSVQHFEESLAMGITAPYHFALRLKEHMSEGSSIIHILSTRAFQSQKDNEAYSAAKGGLNSLTHALANSLGPKIRVNAIAPGWIDTKNSTLSPQDHHQHPSGRVGSIDDVVSAVLFLCSKQASFIQGQTLIVDGGMSKRMIYHQDEAWLYQGE
jgi:NAD(P)-dependent dehydrogenase (short-subunit alcohol dehydrogenase family)